jgi:hypothetical protein
MSGLLTSETRRFCILPSRGSLPSRRGLDVTANSARFALDSSHVSEELPGVPISKQSGNDQAPGREMCPWFAMLSTSTMTRVHDCRVSVLLRHMLLLEMHCREHKRAGVSRSTRAQHTAAKSEEQARSSLSSFKRERCECAIKSIDSGCTHPRINRRLHHLSVRRQAH